MKKIYGAEHFRANVLKRDIMAKNTQGVTQVRQIKPDYIDNLVNELSKKDLWTEVIENNDPNESYDIFYNKLYNKILIII